MSSLLGRTSLSPLSRLFWDMSSLNSLDVGYSCPNIVPPLYGTAHRLFGRWTHPIQQQGRRIPSFNSEQTLFIWFSLVSSCFTDTVQQIHSFRASGVISSHFARAFGSEVSAFRRSTGRLCTVPDEILIIMIFYQIFLASREQLETLAKKNRWRKRIAPVTVEKFPSFPYIKRGAQVSFAPIAQPGRAAPF